MTQVFVTRGRKKFDPSALRPCTQVISAPDNKPECISGGLLWTTTLRNGTTAWIKRVLSDYPEWFGKWAVLFKRPRVFVLQLRSPADYGKLVSSYPPTKKILDRASYGIDNPVDWAVVAQDYDAVHVTQKAINQVPDLDLWDFESTVWFNPSRLEVDQISPVDRKTGKIDLSQDVTEEATRKQTAMKGEVTLKKNSKTKFTVYLNSEKIGELNRIEETVGREDDIAYLWFWDPAGDRFRDRELENGGYYNPNKLFSEIEELVARTPEKKKGTVTMRRRKSRSASRHKQAQLQELLQQYESASGRIIKMLTQAHQAALGKKFDQANRILQKLDGVVENEVLSGLMGLNDTMAGVVGFEASSTPEEKGKKAMLRRRRLRLAQKTPVATIDIFRHEDGRDGYYTVQLTGLDGKPYRGEYADMIPTKVEASNAAEALTEMAHRWNLSGFLE